MKGAEVAACAADLLDDGAAGFAGSSEWSHSRQSAYRVSLYPTSQPIAAFTSASRRFL
jgi:hypothetical protein